MNSNRKIQGMSLVELMIALAIMGIIAAIGIPTYNNQIMSTKRDEAKTTLVQLKLQQENYRLENISYATAVQLGNPVLEYYTLTVTNISGTAFTLTATAKSGTRQAHDTGCTVLNIDQSMTRTPATCG